MPIVRWSDSLGQVLAAANIFRVVVLCAEYLVLSAIGVRLLVAGWCIRTHTGVAGDLCGLVQLLLRREETSSG
jgi:hypothetical protein